MSKIKRLSWSSLKKNRLVITCRKNFKKTRTRFKIKILIKLKPKSRTKRKKMQLLERFIFTTISWMPLLSPIKPKWLTFWINSPWNVVARASMRLSHIWVAIHSSGILTLKTLKFRWRIRYRLILNQESQYGMIILLWSKTKLVIIAVCGNNYPKTCV